MTDGIRTSAGPALPWGCAAAIAAILSGACADWSFAGEEDDLPLEPATPEWWANPEPADGRIIVNGKVLTPSEVNTLSFVSCGPIVPGNYWLNVQTGQWGFTGNPTPMGHFRARCHERRRFNNGSMSRDGRIFNPGELDRNESDWGGPRIQE